MIVVCDRLGALTVRKAAGVWRRTGTGLGCKARQAHDHGARAVRQGYSQRRHQARALTSPEPPSCQQHYAGAFPVIDDFDREMLRLAVARRSAPESGSLTEQTHYREGLVMPHSKRSAPAVHERLAAGASPAAVTALTKSLTKRRV